MKNILITASLFLSVATMAQESDSQDDALALKGKIQIGGGVSFWQGERKYQVEGVRPSAGGGYDSLVILQQDSKSSGFSLNPGVGVFITEKLLVGVMFRMHHQKYESHYDMKTVSKDREYVFGGYMRLHQKVSKKLFVFEHLDFGYGIGEISSDRPESKDFKKNIFEANISPGIMYFIHPRLSVETTFGLFSYYNVTGRTTDYVENVSGRRERNENFSYGTSLSFLRYAMRFYL